VVALDITTQARIEHSRFLRALLQTFPEDYDFYDDWEDVGVSNLGRLIGNAVPQSSVNTWARQSFRTSVRQRSLLKLLSLTIERTDVI